MGKHDEAWMILKRVHDTNMRAKGTPEKVFTVSDGSWHPREEYGPTSLQKFPTGDLEGLVRRGATTGSCLLSWCHLHTDTRRHAHTNIQIHIDTERHRDSDTDTHRQGLSYMQPIQV